MVDVSAGVAPSVEGSLAVAVHCPGMTEYAMSYSGVIVMESIFQFHKSSPIQDANRMTSFGTK